MNTLFSIRFMEEKDISSVLRIECMCYIEAHLIESRESLRAKFIASPSTCYIANQEDKVIGHLISIPWCFENPPELNMLTCDLPSNPDCLYLHDLAVVPNVRKAGVGRALVEKFFERCKALNFKRASLIAVQNSKSYWNQYGFRSVQPTTILRSKLLNYGNNVEYMEYFL
jgi:predicted N-acetyltransferase YhbS